MEDYKLIDLGLPSGTLWMDRNIGALSPTDFGLYFAWGETQGHNLSDLHVANGVLCFEENCKYINGTNNKVTKYCSMPALGDNGYTDNITTLEMSDDAAYQFTNGECRMPTKEEIQELIYNTTYKWTTINGKNGALFTSKTNGNSIFITTGHEDYGEFNGHIRYITIWSSSLHENINSNPYNLYDSRAWFLYCSSTETDCFSWSRANGRPIRGVKSK